MAAPLDVAGQVKQLNEARKLVLGDAAYYPQIIQGILPIIGPHAHVELRRWGADFLAETFASPSLPAHQKETMCLVVLDTLRDMLENPQEDAAVVKCVVQAAASVYPLVFRWMYVAPYSPPFALATSSLEPLIEQKRILPILPSSYAKSVLELRIS